jgi:beta-N-acetylhexosaminidase
MAANKGTAGSAGTRWRWLVALAALAVVVARAGVAASTLIGQANISTGPVATVVLPTPPPSTHQLTPTEYARQIVQGMSLNDEIAQMLMIDENGLTLPPDQVMMLQQQHVGGVLIFGSYITSAQQVQQLTSSIVQNSPLAPFIATDQEGGQVDRLGQIPSVGPSPGEDQIGQMDSQAFARQQGVLAAQHLEAFGFNFNLAPVVDLTSNNDFTNGLYGRTYSSDPSVVAQMADAYLRGLQADGKVVGTLKHFPGLGASSDNPDHVIPVVNLSQQQLKSQAFVPYRLLLRLKHVHVIMVTHIILPQIDPNTPATISHKVITGLLRDDLGYQGLIITDDLRRLGSGELTQNALLSIEAGSDILIGPLFSTDVAAIITAVTNAITTGQLTKARIDASVVRILTEKINLHLIPLPKVRVPNGTPSPTPRPTGTTTPAATRQP